MAAPRVFARRYLLEVIWVYAPTISTEMIEVHPVDQFAACNLK